MKEILKGGLAIFLCLFGILLFLITWIPCLRWRPILRLQYKVGTWIHNLIPDEYRCHDDEWVEVKIETLKNKKSKGRN